LKKKETGFVLYDIPFSFYSEINKSEIRNGNEKEYGIYKNKNLLSTSTRKTISFFNTNDYFWPSSIQEPIRSNCSITASINNQIRPIQKYSLSDNEFQQNTGNQYTEFKDFDYSHCGSLVGISLAFSNSQVNTFDIFFNLNIKIFRIWNQLLIWTIR